MKNTGFENVIIIRKPTRLEQLKSRFNTKEQAKFYMQQNKVAFKEKKMASSVAKMAKEEIFAEQQAAFEEAEAEYQNYEAENANFYNSLSEVEKKLSSILKVKILFQDYLPSFTFGPQDMIIVLGQDGLVANTAKYVDGLPIIGINPDPSRYDGILLKYNTENFLEAVKNLQNNNHKARYISMAEAKLNDGQHLLAFNDFFIGINSHASAQYSITFKGKTEYQSSSGVIVSTGAGSTGWLSSFYNMTKGFMNAFVPNVQLKSFEFSQDANYLMFVVREPFVSRTSQANIVVGKLESNEILKIESNMPQNGVIFSDGVQKDFLEFNVGTIAEIGLAKQKAVLI